MNQRKVILYIAQSLDGYIARSNHKLDWLPQSMASNMESFYQNFSQKIDTVLMGRQTYEQITTVLSPNEWLYTHYHSYIWTHGSYSSTKNITFTDDDIVEFVSKLKTQEGKDIWVLGGAHLAHPLIKEGLIDDYMITIVPVILGEGISLFKREPSPTQFLQLQQCFDAQGMIQTHYTVLR